MTTHGPRPAEKSHGAGYCRACYLPMPCPALGGVAPDPPYAAFARVVLSPLVLP